MSTGRLLVQRGIYNQFVERLVAKARSLTVGNPAQSEVALGPLINEQQRDHVYRVVQAAQRAGARLDVGGSYDGLFFQPTVLSDVQPTNPAFHEEVFGPVAIVVPFDSDADAVQLANDTEYGLSAAIISKDVGRALNLGERLRTGLLHINDQTVNDEVINPFGGVGASGNGTSIGGAANGEEFTQWQWLTLKGEAPAYPL
jgi:benzaldehyde dehydrogenase (NAD)